MTPFVGKTGWLASPWRSQADRGRTRFQPLNAGQYSRSSFLLRARERMNKRTVWLSFQSQRPSVCVCVYCYPAYSPGPPLQHNSRVQCILPAQKEANGYSEIGDLGIFRGHALAVPYIYGRNHASYGKRLGAEKRRGRKSDRRCDEFDWRSESIMPSTSAQYIFPCNFLSDTVVTQKVLPL